MNHEPKPPKPEFKCIVCGKRVPLFWNPFAQAWFARTTVLALHDKKHRFCTATCAVRYAVDAVEEK